MPIKFLANHNIIIYGPTRAGKTRFTLEVLEKKLIHPFPENIYFMYSAEQSFMADYPGIHFIKGLDFSKIDVSKPSVVVLDDMLHEINKDVASHFLISSHHYNITLFFLTQSLFPNNNTFRIISSNCHYFIIFQNQRSFREVHTLARQIYVGSDIQRILAAYKRAAECQRGFILLSFAPSLPSELTVSTDFFQSCPSIYL